MKEFKSTNGKIKYNGRMTKISKALRRLFEVEYVNVCKIDGRVVLFDNSSFSYIDQTPDNLCFRCAFEQQHKTAVYLNNCYGTEIPAVLNVNHDASKTCYNKS